MNRVFHVTDTGPLGPLDSKIASVIVTEAYGNTIFLIDNMIKAFSVSLTEKDSIALPVSDKWAVIRAYKISVSPDIEDLEIQKAWRNAISMFSIKNPVEFRIPINSVVYTGKLLHGRVASMFASQLRTTIQNALLV